jgi:hypothetical protein
LGKNGLIVMQGFSEEPAKQSRADTSLTRAGSYHDVAISNLAGEFADLIRRGPRISIKLQTQAEQDYTDAWST